MDNRIYDNRLVNAMWSLFKVLRGEILVFGGSHISIFLQQNTT